MNIPVITFRKKYFLFAFLLLLTEMAIAAFLHDKVIRPHVGDVLVVMLIYCFLRAFFNISVKAAAVFVFVFACLVEGLQYVHIVNLQHLEHAQPAKTIIGSNFSWLDIGAYFTGIVLMILIERKTFHPQK